MAGSVLTQNNNTTTDAIISSSGLVAHEPRVLLRCKVVIVGDDGVGKTSLVQSFESLGSSCPKYYVMTLGVEFTVKEVAVIPNTRNTTVDLHLYTTGGQSIVNQREMSSSFWANADYIVCVYDIGSRHSFQNCTKWVQQVRSNNAATQAGKLSCLLIGNKADFRNELGENSRVEVAFEEAQSYAQEHEFTYFECSALLGKGIDIPFQHIANDFNANLEAGQTLATQKRDEQFRAP